MNGSTPVVSVIVPTYSHEHYVEDALRSVEAQTFTDHEIIVINDGSPDKTAERLRPWRESGRIRYFEQPNAGQSAARNTGLRLARGRYIAFLDDDDLWPADKLAWQVAALECEPDAVLVYGFSESFGDAGPGYRAPEHGGPSGQAKRAFLRGNHIVTPGQTLIRRDDLVAIGGLDTSLWATDDWDLWIRLADRGQFLYEHRLALHYRCHAENSSKNTRRHFQNGLRLLHKHLGYAPAPNHWSDWWHCRHFIGLFTSATELSNASRLVKQGARGEALRSLARACRFHPPLVLTKRFWKIAFSQKKPETHRA